MANPQYQSFAQTGKASIIATSVSANVALPLTGAPTCAVVTNLGDYVAWVLLGNSSAVVVTSATGFPVLPNQSFILTLGANTYLAALGQGPVDIALGN